jgi:hypothetical protein
MFRFKAQFARNSRAIAKICNAEAGHSEHKIRVHELIRGSLISTILFYTTTRTPVTGHKLTLFDIKRFIDRLPFMEATLAQN